MRYLTFLLILLMSGHAAGQSDTAWIRGQLDRITWQKTYSGVLAEYHKVIIVLATDGHLVAGTLVHEGDSEVHRLIGDWNANKQMQLQERDINDRLTGYLRGDVSEDHLSMEWISADQKRAFRVNALPGDLIRIGGFKAVSEWIEVSTQPAMAISVQKMDFGMISGLLIRQGVVTRFEGRCQDGQCSIWNATLPGDDSRPTKLSMRQRSATAYTVGFNGGEYAGVITFTAPLKVNTFSNRAGFMDLVWPDLPGKTYAAWVEQLKTSFWPEEMKRLQAIEREDTGTRLAHRTSGWIEILEANEDMVSGLMTVTQPGSTRREAFVWLRREDELMTDEAWLNTPANGKDISLLALNNGHAETDASYMEWLRETGYAHTLPVRYGLLATTDFHIVYGDDLNALPASAVRPYVKKKYWRYFHWPDK